MPAFFSSFLKRMQPVWVCSLASGLFSRHHHRHVKTEIKFTHLLSPSPSPSSSSSCSSSSSSICILLFLPPLLLILPFPSNSTCLQETHNALSLTLLFSSFHLSSIPLSHAHLPTYLHKPIFDSVKFDPRTRIHIKLLLHTK